LLRHRPSGVPIEVSIAWLPFEEQALARANEVRLGTASVPTATAEDLVVYKAVAWRERDRWDIERLLVLHADRIDLTRVRERVAEFANVLERPDLASEFEDLVRRTKSDP
jgi:predicted nucleotidyltransferase